MENNAQYYRYSFRERLRQLQGQLPFENSEIKFYKCKIKKWANNYQEDKLGLLAVERGRRQTERTGGVFRALGGGVPECLSSYSVIIQLLLKVCRQTSKDG